MISYSNHNAELAFQLQENSFVLSRFQQKDGVNFATGNLPLWKIELIDQDKKISSFSADRMPDSHFVQEQLVMVWQCGNTAKVTVTAAPSGEDAFELKIAVSELAEKYSVREIYFPCFAWALDEDDSCKLILPEDAGTVYPDPLKNLVSGASHLTIPRVQKRSYPHGGFVMQFFALERNGILAYCGAHDPDALVKAFNTECKNEEKALWVRPHWHAAREYGKSVGSFSWILAVNEGDWYDAAMRYRQFALTAPWMKRGPLEHGGKTPEWMLKTPLFTLKSQRGSGREVSDLLQEAEFFQVPIMTHYYMYHKTAFDSEYPFFFPTVPGFREDVKKLKDAGIRVVPYTNFFSADTATDDWSYLQHSAMKINEEGEIHAPVWSQQRALAEMCTGDKLWRRMTQQIALRMLETDVAGIYVDEVGMSPPYACCAENHDHKPGDPAVFSKSWCSLLESIKAEAAEFRDTTVFANEGAAEPLIGVIDSMLIGNANSAFFKPLLSAVYHDYVMCYGRYTFAQEVNNPNFVGAAESKHAEQFIMGMQFGWSRVPWNMIMNFSPETAVFIRDMAMAWYDNYKHLAAGKMLRPLTLNVPEIELRWARSWMDMEGAIIKRPAVLNSVWQSDNASIAVVLCNISQEEQTFSIVMPSIQLGDTVIKRGGEKYYKYPLPQASQGYLLEYRNGRKPRVVPQGDSTNGFTVTMQPRSVAVLQISSEKPYGVHHF